VLVSALAVARNRGGLFYAALGFGLRIRPKIHSRAVGT
jgi:hypothetical protein